MDFIDLKTQYRILKKQVDGRIQAVLDHGCFIMGPEVAELEQRLAALCGARHCITMSSGTDALLAALMVLDIGPGDEVVTSAFSFISAAEVVVRLGAVPVFVDIEADTCNINAARIAEKITRRTRAIIPVSLYGQPADMDEINRIADRHGLTVIEDGAQSFGAEYCGRKSGNLCTIGCTSFFPTKPLGCYGDGGAIFTSDDRLARIMAEIRVHGQFPRYRHRRIGMGGRMDTLQCAIVLAKLEQFEWEVQARCRIAERYDRYFAGRVAAVTQRVDRRGVYAQYTVMPCRGAEMQQRLQDAGIPSVVHYPLTIPQQAAYRRFADGAGHPVAESIAQRVLSLPLNPYMDEQAVETVAAAVLDAAPH